MHARTCTQKHTYIHICVHIHAYTHKLTYTHTNIHTYVQTFPPRQCTAIHVRRPPIRHHRIAFSVFETSRTRIHTCMHAYIHTYIHAHIHTYTQTFPPRQCTAIHVFGPPIRPHRIAFMHTDIHTYKYTHTYTQTRRHFLQDSAQQSMSVGPLFALIGSLSLSLKRPALAYIHAYIRTYIHAGVSSKTVHSNPCPSAPYSPSSDRFLSL